MQLPRSTRVVSAPVHTGKYFSGLNSEGIVPCGEFVSYHRSDTSNRSRLGSAEVSVNLESIACLSWQGGG